MYNKKINKVICSFIIIFSYQAQAKSGGVLVPSESIEEVVQYTSDFDSLSKRLSNLSFKTGFKTCSSCFDNIAIYIIKNEDDTIDFDNTQLNINNIKIHAERGAANGFRLLSMNTYAKNISIVNNDDTKNYTAFVLRPNENIYNSQSLLATSNFILDNGLVELNGIGNKGILNSKNTNNPDAFSNVLIKNSIFNMNGDNSIGIETIYANTKLDNTIININGADTWGYGSLIYNGAIFSLNNSSYINSDKQNVYALFLSTKTPDGQYPIENNQIANINNSHINVQNGTAIITNSGTGTVNLDNNSSIKSKVLINAQDFKDQNFQTHFTLNVNNNSSVTGITLVSTNSQSNINLNNNSIWNITGNSWLSNININKSIVNFSNSSNSYTTLTVDSLSATNGSVIMNTNIAKQLSDRIIVTNQLIGDFVLTINNNGSLNTTGNEVLTVVASDNNQSTWRLKNKVEAGAYEYGLRASKDNANNLELYATSEKKLTTAALAAGNMININYLIGYVENQTLFQRMGDLRSNIILNSGFWIKGFGGKLSSFNNQLSNFNMNYIGTQFGYDLSTNLNSGVLLIGAMAGYTNTKPKYSKNNDGHGTSFNLGSYISFYSNHGLYLDAIIKYNFFRNHINVYDTANNKITGTGHTNGFYSSFEVGKRFWIDNNKEGLHFDIQSQISYGTIKRDSFTASNGLNTKISSTNSLIGRVSILGGYSKDTTNVYTKISYAKEFKGNVGYIYNNGKLNKYSFGGDWLEIGIGLNLDIDKNNKIYSEINYSNGKRFNNKNFMIGYRYSF